MFKSGTLFGPTGSPAVERIPFQSVKLQCVLLFQSGQSVHQNFSMPVTVPVNPAQV